MIGKLYGVGVGPGASDLMTLRAVNVLRAVPVLAIPRRDAFTPSFAWRIAQPAVGEVPGQEGIFLEFPMTKDPARLVPAWDKALGQIGGALEAGHDVAFLTEGDPLVYSTFIYLREAALARWPRIAVEIVPAVTSLTAVAAAAGVPLADGQERVAVLPATYGVDDLVEVLERFDTTVLMKVGSVMGQVVDALERTGLLHHAVYVSKASTPDETIVRDLRTLRNDKCDYFSMVIVAKKTRSGVLRGRLAASTEEARA